MDWIMQKFLLKYVKGFLDKLPANGVKTALGILLIILNELGKVYGGTPYGSVILWVVNFINGLGGSPEAVTTIGLGTALVGLVHRALKIFGQEPK